MYLLKFGGKKTNGKEKLGQNYEYKKNKFNKPPQQTLTWSTSITSG
jgi:hypothetical protein